MANIVKRGDYQWMARVRHVGYKTQVKTFETKAQAQAWAHQVESDMSRGTFEDVSSIAKVTLDSLLADYLVKETPRKKGAEQEAGLIKRLRTRPIAKRYAVTIKANDIANYRNDRLTEVANATVAKEMNLISAVYKVAVAEWAMRGLVNPVSGVRRPQPPKGRQRRLMSSEELTCILAATQSKVLKSFLLVAVETGMRRGEMVDMRQGNVDLSERTMFLDDSKNGNIRAIPLSSKALEVVEALPERSDHKLFNAKADSMTQAFIRARKRARKLYEKQCAQEGVVPDEHFLVDIRLHDMRREATSSFFERGLSIMEVSSITGHQSFKMLKTYTQLRARELAIKLG